MYSRRDKRKKKQILVFIACIIFGIGYYFLNVVSTIFEVPLGNTFHVILGCTLMAMSGLYIIYTIKQLYFTKKKARTKRIFLNEDELKKKN
jgi:predicted membrane protein